MLTSYARLLVHYCLAVKEGDNILIATTTLAEPLLREVYREALAAGAALVECDLSFQAREQLLLLHASDRALQTPNTLNKLGIETFDGYLHIRAPYNLRELQQVPAERAKMRSAALSDINQTYFRRIADGSLRRNLCQYPTEAAAQEAGMSLSEYEQFVFKACKLDQPDPIAAWMQGRAEQQHIVDYLNRCRTVRYVTEGTDIQFSTVGRTWINSDGRANMPSGEVYTSPVEDSVQGHIHFSLPCLYQGHEVEGVTLQVRDGWIERWEARQGQEVLDQVFSQPGTRRFGEAAIGTNYSIDRMTKNILFDEKIGGTIHMAIGQSYLQAGGKNESSVHWDMITDMTQGGAVYADGHRIYENGQFLL